MSEKGTAAGGGSISEEVKKDLAEIAEALYRVQVRLGIALDPGLKIRWRGRVRSQKPKRTRKA